MLTLGIECISIFVASAIKGITAFGFNIIAVPTLILFMSPKVVVPVISLLSALGSLYLLAGLYKHVQIRRVLPLIVGTLIGVPIGVFGLIVLNANILKVAIGFVVTAFAILFAIGHRREIKNETPAFLLLGLISGILGGSSALAGPPIILFFVNQDYDKVAFRANITLFFVLQSLFSLLGYARGNLITAEVLRYFVIYLIPMTLGTFIGMRLVHRVNEKLFRQITLLILIVSGITSIYTGLSVLP